MKKSTFKNFLIAGLLLSASLVQAQLFNTFETNSGSISLGPADSSSAHIYTDRPKFLFNEDIYSYKGGFSSYTVSDLFLKTNGKTRLTINKDKGFVGIGTLHPTQKLDVVGSANIHHDLKVQQNLEVKGTVKLATIDTLTTSENPIVILNSEGKLNVVPFNHILYGMYSNPCGSETRYNGISYYAPMWTNLAGFNPTIYTGVECPASVGIGTSSPEAKLHVTGNAKIGEELEVGESNNTNTNLTVHGAAKLDLGLEIGNATQNDIKLEVHNDALFDRRVAIGTSPQDGYDLAVCGNIRAGDIKVNAVADWCDYVFEDNYNLRNLQEVEAFIQKNKHLPEIPSAIELETQGIGVSQMLLLMMKKIEELTLYSIDLKKEIETLKKAQQ